MNTEGLLVVVWENLSRYVFSSDILTGLWLWFLLFGFATVLRLEFAVGLILLLPLTGVLMAFGYIPLAAGGAIILLSGVILAFSFFQNR